MNISAPQLSVVTPVNGVSCALLFSDEGVSTSIADLLGKAGAKKIEKFNSAASIFQYLDQATVSGGEMPDAIFAAVSDGSGTQLKNWCKLHPNSKLNKIKIFAVKEKNGGDLPPKEMEGFAAILTFPVELKDICRLPEVRSKSLEKRVLTILEDNPNDVMLLERTMQQTGCNFQRVILTSLNEMEDYIFGRSRFSDRSKYPLPGVVFVDPGLPDGKALPRLKVWKQHLGLSVMMIVLTSNFREADEGYAAGADSFLVKPVTTKDLASLLNYYPLSFQKLAPES